MRSARRLLRARPRLLLTIVLAFALEAVRPITPPLWHQHRGGDHAHVHVSTELNAHHHPERAAAPAPGRESRSGVALAAALDAHLHVVRTLHPVVVPALAPLAPELPFVPLPDPIALDLGVARPARALARGPPATPS